VNAREVRAERENEPIGIGNQTSVAREPMRGRNAWKPFHHEEFVAEHGRVGAEEQRLRRERACRVRTAQHLVLVAPRQAAGHA